MSSMIEQFKQKMEALKKLNEKRKEEAENNYAKKYYSDMGNYARGNNMTVMIEDNGNICYYVSRGNHDTFTYAAGYISSLRDVMITEEKTNEDLLKYGCIIIEATPVSINSTTNVYIPETITEQQEAKLQNFERQVEEYNKTAVEKVNISKIKGNNLLSDENNEKTL